jgi:hypothetical protein
LICFIVNDKNIMLRVIFLYESTNKYARQRRAF